jgi:hypothetical protein
LRFLLLSELEHRGAGGGCGGFEQAGEWAGGHAGSDVLRVAGVLEQVRVGVERDGDARMAEDAADLGRVEPEVDDQVAGEGVAQVVEAKRRPAVSVQPGELGGPPPAPRSTSSCTALVNSPSGRRTSRFVRAVTISS